MRERKRILDQWLSNLRAERELIEGAILEINTMEAHGRRVIEIAGRQRLLGG